MKKNLFIAILILAVAGIFIYYRTKSVPKTENIPTKPVEENKTPVSISTKDIKEDNFTGKVALISGSSLVAIKAQTYVDGQVADFRKQANTDVPPMRKEFGADSPTANYEIDIEAKYEKGDKTESAILNVYTYTGGAHGSSFYKQSAFTAFIKRELTAWRPEGSTGSVVFPEDVEALTFGSFTNWSLGDKNLTLYFDQYEIGPGALGATAFPLPLSKIKDFLEPNF
jgi:hypothetical protein